MQVSLLRIHRQGVAAIGEAPNWLAATHARSGLGFLKPQRLFCSCPWSPESNESRGVLSIASRAPREVERARPRKVMTRPWISTAAAAAAAMVLRNQRTSRRGNDSSICPESV